MANFSFKKIKEKISFKGGRDKSKIDFRIYRDWGIVLVIFFILLALIAVVNVYLFTLINNGEIFEKERPPEEDIEMLNTKMLKNTIDFFDTRAENFENILKQKPDIVDPSL